MKNQYYFLLLTILIFMSYLYLDNMFIMQHYKLLEVIWNPSPPVHIMCNLHYKWYLQLQETRDTYTASYESESSASASESFSPLPPTDSHNVTANDCNMNQILYFTHSMQRNIYLYSLSISHSTMLFSNLSKQIYLKRHLLMLYTSRF